MKRSSVLGSGGGSQLSFKFLKIFLVIASTAAVTSAARRHDIPLPAAPTPEALREIADAVGAATFEELTLDAISDTSRPKAKELKTRVPEDDVEYQTYQGVMGRPGVDFPVLPSIPQTFFDCKKVATGYYADLETDCQVFHICDGGRKISFLCPNGTIFRQSNLICDWWFKVDCADSPGQYEESAEHLAEDQRKSEKQSKKQPLPAQNFETIHTTHKRPQTNYASNIHTGHNHITDYKAEASFNSVAQSGVPASDAFRTQETKVSSKPSPRSFQVTPRQDRITNSRQYSSFEHTTTKVDPTVNDEDHHRKTNTYKYSPTRRTMLDYTDAATYRGSTQASRNYKEPKETQVVAESASFANSRGRNNYYHFSSNYDNKVRSTVETSHSYSSPTAARTTRPTYTTTYIPGSKNYVEVTRSVSRSVASSSRPKSSPQTYDYSISTTAQLPSASTKKENKLYSFAQYSQTPTLSTPNNNNYRVTINESPNNRPSNSIEIRTSIKEDIKNVTKPSFKNYWIPPVKTENVTFYAPTVPTVTPKAYNATTNRFLATNWYSNVESDVITTPQTTSYSSEPAVAEHAVDMLKTLEELEFGSAEPTTETEKFLGKRPGLFVPPSAGPNTLHSLAIYFATAVDNLVSTPYPTTVSEEIEEELVTEEERIPEENRDSYTSLLSQKTLDKYTNLFKNTSSESSSESLESNESDEIANNDLESSQSRGPLSSSPQIRELAQVFTHALSAYLQDPETFRKVLSEIRPTDPTIAYEPSSTTTAYTPIEETTAKNDFYSLVKDEEEVLDFSDVSKNSPHPTPTAYDTSATSPPNGDSTKAYSVDLIKNRLLLTTSAYRHQTPIYYSNTKNKTPASSIITHDHNDFDSTQNEIRQGKVLSTTIAPSTSNAVAIEINGGLSDTNKRVPQRFINGNNHSNCTESSKYETDSSYFPLDAEGTVKSVPRYGGFQNNSSENISPYGAGIKPSNSTPINGAYSGALSATEAIPLHWGDIISTKLSTIPDNPSAPSFDLTPPTKQFNKLDSVEMSVINSFVPEDLNDLEINNKTEDFDFQTTEQPQTVSTLNVNNRERVTFKYRSHSADRGMYYNSFKTSSDNEEQLQRAQSQSFVASANQIGRRGKKIESQSKTNKNENVNSDKPSFNPTVTLRTSNGVILSLPTLKDILSKPVSTVPTEPNTTEMSTIASSSETPTTVTTQDTTLGTTKFEETTPLYESSTTIEYSNPSTRAQVSSTSQENIWSTSAALGQIWQTTVFLDPITINEGLSSDTDRESILPSANTYIPRGSTQGWRYFSDKTYEPSTLVVTEQTEALSDLNITTTSGSFETSKIPETTIAPEETTTINTQTYERFPPTYSGVVDNEKSNLQINKPREEQLKSRSSFREGKSLSSSASPNLILERLNASDVDQTMMNKAKEMFGGLNASSANTLMNVMKKADKNTTVRRLILLLVQTCDDDHNKTIEASRAALLDALMRIPSEQTETIITQNPLKDETEIVGEYEPREITTTDLPSYSNRRSDEIIDTDDTKYPVSVKLSSRRGKQIDVDSTYPSTIQETTSTDQSTIVVTEPSSTTLTETPVSTSTSTLAPIVTVKMSRRGHRKYFVKTTKTPIYSKQTDERSLSNSVDKGTVSSVEDQSVPSDTRALELLRSLYSLAARWG